MANTTIALKKSSTPSAVPAALANGELALNFADGKLYYKNVTGQIVSFSAGGGNSFGIANVDNTLILSGTGNDVLNLRSGNNITLSACSSSKTITFNGNVVTVSNAAPPSPSANSLWWNSDLGALFIYYNDGDSYQWVEIAGGGGGVGGGGAALSRATLYANTTTLATDSSQNITITGYKSYVLTSITANNSAWVRVYTDTASRTADASRSIGVDPAAGSGVIAEVVTSGSQTVNITPFVVGGNLDNPVTSNVYVTITNKSGSTLPIGINMTVIGLES